jgi:hypothetical protein
VRERERERERCKNESIFIQGKAKKKILSRRVSRLKEGKERVTNLLGGMEEREGGGRKVLSKE